MPPTPASPLRGARVTLGNRELDAMCGGGPFQDSVILISGPTGTGKTLLSLEFLDAADGDQRGLLVAFEESPQQLRGGPVAGRRWTTFASLVGIQPFILRVSRGSRNGS